MTNEERDMFMSMLTVALEGARYHGVLYERAAQQYNKDCADQTAVIKAQTLQANKDNKEIWELKTKLANQNPIIFTQAFDSSCDAQKSACGQYKILREPLSDSASEWKIFYYDGKRYTYLGRGINSIFVKAICNAHQQTLSEVGKKKNESKE